MHVGMITEMILVAAQSKAFVCSRWLTEIAGSISGRGVDASLF
jgi:hypothetical protein